MIKKLTTASEFEEMHALSGYAFNREHSPEEKKIFLKTATQTTTWGVLEEDQLTSQIMVFPLSINLAGQQMKMAGIGNVSTYPENRGNGGIRQLFQTIFEDLYQQKVELSYLAPFSYAFYRQFGYEQVFDTRHFNFSQIEAAQIKPEKSGKIRRVAWQETPYQEAIKQLYAKTLGTEDGSLVREDWWWDYVFELYSTRKLALCFDDQDVLQGYISYDLGDNQFIIHELAYVNAFAYRKLATFIGSHAGSFAKFSFHNAKKHELVPVIPEARATSETLYPSMMARIVSFQAFIENFTFSTNSETTFTLGVIDSNCPWNQGTWKISLSPTGTHCDLLSPDILADAELTADIKTWTQGFMGYLTLEHLGFIDQVQGAPEKIKELSNLLPTHSTALYDFF